MKSLTLRTKFVATALLPFVFILMLFIISGFTLYVLGLFIPLTALCIYCYVTPKREFIGLISTVIVRWGYGVCTVIGTILLLLVEQAYYFSWFASAILFFIAEPVVRKILLSLGFIGNG